ncbi:MAG: hypothetical protein U1E38_00465 [Rhodospirillales bacterium]
MLPTSELNAIALKIMQEELAERQRNRHTAARDAHGHPARSAPPFPAGEWAAAA